MGCESSEVFVTEWVLFLNHCSENTSLISDNLREVSRFEYLPNENDRRRWVGHAVVARLKIRPIHACIWTGGNAHVDCKRRSVLVMPLVFFFFPSFLLSVHASFKWCQVNGGAAERIFLFKILDIDSRGVHALCEDPRNDDDWFRLLNAEMSRYVAKTLIRLLLAYQLTNASLWWMHRSLTSIMRITPPP